MQNTLILPLRGIIPPVVTPLLNNNTLDVEGLERLLEHIISGGVHGVFILGTTGELPSLSHKLRYELIERTCLHVNDRVPVLVGISDCVFPESLSLAHKAADCGADAVVLAPPYYFALSQSEFLGYLERLVPQIPLPIFLYNIPVYTKVKFAPETVKAAAGIPGIIGLKDSSSDLVYLKQVQYALKDRPDFTFMVGQEELLAEFVLTGGHGGVNGGANMFPKLYVNLYNASVARDLDQVLKLLKTVMQVSSSVYLAGNSPSSYLKGLKCALSLMGICSGFMAEPYSEFGIEERCSIEKSLEELDYKSLF
ncbi:MAG: dihydrodipicolinate synthase family protein [Bacteroidales bacterium]|nr:dihydrodipicolinate synthase family protein [Bacteroidales bacterium]